MVNYTKRRAIFHWLQRKRVYVIFLQEAHCTKEN
jgi:hypothetical protein